jgi:drug/metabolite transporter (DMT)-like permease
MLTLIIRKPPAPTLWIGFALATLGIWLMTGATPTGFGLGELLGLTSSIIFSSYLFVMNAAVERDDPCRIAGGQFIAIGAICGVACALVYPETFHREVLFAPFKIDALLNLSLLVVFATLGGFGLMTFYQPKLDPSRAALIYLTEPIFAASYAYLVAGRTMTGHAVAGAALILAANGLAEWIEYRKRSKLPAEDLGAAVAR